ncbi:MAG: hypothetical protein P1S59_14010 [bacterium]|nr:hypothetical protein [bacterium]
MLISRYHQRSFYDTDSVCEELIPEDSFYRKFREIITPIIDNSMFESMYCGDNGRPPVLPKPFGPGDGTRNFLGQAACPESRRRRDRRA